VVQPGSIVETCGDDAAAKAEFFEERYIVVWRAAEEEEALKEKADP
jgi:hypothetical protein